MATPGLCKGLWNAAVTIIGGAVVAAACLTLFFASTAAPMAGMLMGSALGLLVSYQSDRPGDKRVQCSSAALAGFCGGVIAHYSGAPLGAIFATLVAVMVYFLTMATLAKLFKE